MEITKICWRCGVTVVLRMTETQYDKWISSSRGFIQDIFPELSADEREILISSTCGKCFDEIWSEK